MRSSQMNRGEASIVNLANYISIAVAPMTLDFAKIASATFGKSELIRKGTSPSRGGQGWEIDTGS